MKAPRVPKTRSQRSVALQNLELLGELLIMKKALELACEYLSERGAGDPEDLRRQLWQEANAHFDRPLEDS